VPLSTASILAAQPTCYEDPTNNLCRAVYDWTRNERLAEFSDWLIAKPAKVVLIVVVALVLRWLLHRAIGRLADRAAAVEGTLPGILTRGRVPGPAGALGLERRAQRAATMGSVLKSITTGVVFGIAALMVLAELSLDIGPLIASAGIIGVAIGFGAQALVKDFLSGIFMILEDQYGVGDVVDLGEASGSVEAVGLRVSRLRDLDGTVWYVRNGEVIRVGNKSQGWARAVVDVDVSYEEDINEVRELLKQTAHELFVDPAFEGVVLEEPEVWGVEALTAHSVVVRVVVKTAPLKQWDVARTLRERIKTVFDAHGIEIPYWLRAEGPGAEAGAPP
jgi:small-conductance mechanosensitive channel